MATAIQQHRADSIINAMDYIPDPDETEHHELFNDDSTHFS